MNLNRTGLAARTTWKIETFNQIIHLKTPKTQIKLEN